MCDFGDDLDCRQGPKRQRKDPVGVLGLPYAFRRVVSMPVNLLLLALEMN
jgi:hypothetical protein